MLRSLADDAEIKDTLPFLPLMTQQLENAAPRPVTPNYNDISLAVRQVLHPLQRRSNRRRPMRSCATCCERALDCQAVL